MHTSASEPVCPSESKLGTPGVQRCTRCDLFGHVAEQCPSFRQPPLRHADANSRGAGPHMRQ
eukprot:923573-Karenia_brevis.AAC.1